MDRPTSTGRDDVQAWLRSVCAPLPRVSEHGHGLSTSFYVGGGVRNCFATCARDSKSGQTYVEIKSDDHAVLHDARFVTRPRHGRLDNSLRLLVDDNTDWAWLTRLILDSHGAAQRYFNSGALLSPDLKNVNRQLLAALEGADENEKPAAPFHGGGPTPALPMLEQIALLHASAISMRDLLPKNEIERADQIDRVVRGFLDHHLQRIAAPTWARVDGGIAANSVELEGHRSPGKKDSFVLRAFRSAASACASYETSHRDMASRSCSLALTKLTKTKCAPARMRAWLHDVDLHVVEAEAAQLLMEKKAPRFPPLGRVIARLGDDKDRVTSVLIRMSPPRFDKEKGFLVDDCGLLWKEGRRSTWTASDREHLRHDDDLERARLVNDPWIEWLRDIEERHIDGALLDLIRFVESADTLDVTPSSKDRTHETFPNAPEDWDVITRREKRLAKRKPATRTLFLAKVARPTFAPADVSVAAAIRDNRGEVAAIHLRRCGVTIAADASGEVLCGLGRRMRSVDEAPRHRSIAQPRSGEHAAFAIACAILGVDGPCLARVGRDEDDPEAVILSIFERAADLAVAKIGDELRLVAASPYEIAPFLS